MVSLLLLLVCGVLVFGMGDLVVGVVLVLTLRYVLKSYKTKVGLVLLSPGELVSAQNNCLSASQSFSLQPKCLGRNSRTS